MGVREENNGARMAQCLDKLMKLILQRENWQY
jgi:hypothetical protein